MDNKNNLLESTKSIILGLIKQRDWPELTNYVRTVNIDVFRAVMTSGGTEIIEALLGKKLDFKMTCAIIPLLSFIGSKIKEYRTTNDLIYDIEKRLLNYSTNINLYLNEVQK